MSRRDFAAPGGFGTVEWCHPRVAVSGLDLKGLRAQRRSARHLAVSALLLLGVVLFGLRTYVGVNGDEADQCGM